MFSLILNRITAEVKKNGEIFTKVTGKWNEEIDLEYLKVFFLIYIVFFIFAFYL